MDGRVVVSAWGESPLQALEGCTRLEPMERPEPGPGEVLVRVRSCAVGWVDLLMSSGQYQHMVQPPYTPGLEFAGVVEALGPEVTTAHVGDRVVADGFRTGPRSHGEHQRWGGMATWALMPARAAMPLPEALSFDQGANLLGNYETACHVLMHRARIQPGETVLIHGASGSTGLAAVQVAKLLGAKVIATGRSPDKLAEVKRLGADHVLAIGDEQGGVRRFRDEVKELSEGGVHVVWDGVGGAISLESLRCVRFGARFCIVGWAATPFVAKGKGGRGAPGANQLPTNLIQMKGLDVLGCPAAISTLHDPSLRPRRLGWILQHVALGKLHPQVGPAFALQDYASAWRAKWDSRFVGGCVLHP